MPVVRAGTEYPLTVFERIKDTRGLGSRHKTPLSLREGRRLRTAIGPATGRRQSTAH